MTVELMKHQIDAMEFAIANKGVAAFYHEVGTGKTLTALATFKYLKDKNNGLKLLVICPLTLIYGAWVREIEKHTTATWWDKHGNRGTDKFASIHIINFEYLLSQKKYDNFKQFLAQNPNWMCVIDESSRIKNHKAATVKRILSLVPFFTHRIIMSGTPAPNIEWEYWSQMAFLNPDILGPNFFKFKNTHFALQRGAQIMPGQFLNRASIRKMHEQGFTYQILPKKRLEMLEQMRPWCHFVKAKDCIDLPEEIDEYRLVEMTPTQTKAYKQMKNDYIAELTSTGTFAVANIILTKLMKLRQITSGFAIDDTKKAVAVTTINPKINALLEIIDECKDKQMIIWCQFHWEIDTLVAILTDIGRVSQIHGRINPTERLTEIEHFIDGSSRFLIAHPDSAGHGLTFVNCQVSVFFSLDYSMDAYTQARGRTYRKGQKHNCIYFHLLAENSIDRDVLAIVQKKVTTQEIAERYLKNASKDAVCLPL